jgi:GNAT superfamily N-acetyltransferase
MSSIEIKKVETKKDLRHFIDLHYELYKNSPYDVPSLMMSEMDSLDKKRNAAFDFCEAEYYLAYKDGKPAGRVAAIINNHANEKWNDKSVRFGWIDFINDIDVLKALLKAVEDFGRSKGMTDIVGPLGFTDMDPEGMLSWGFDQLGTMPTIYNYSYYPELMEKLDGFKVDNTYVEFKIDVPSKIPERYAKIAAMVEKRYNLHIKKLTHEDVFKNGYGRRIFELINDTYKDLYGYSELTDKQITQYVKMYMPILDFNLVTVIEDWNADHKLVGIGITIPSLSKALQHCRRGSIWPFGWWHILRAVKFHKTKGIDLLLIGVLPEYRPKGANVLMFSDLIPRANAYGMVWGETQVEMETNENVQSQWAIFNPTLHKRRKCYRKSIN